MSDPTVFSTLLDIKGQLGRLEEGQKTIHETLLNHSAASAAAHTRITQLEMARERQKGMAKVIHIVGIAIGTLAGYVAQAIVGWFKTRGHG